MSSNISSSRSKITELLLRHGVCFKTANLVAANEFRGWDPEIIEGILQKIQRPSIGHCPLQDTDPDPDESLLRRTFSRILSPAWVRPSLDLVRQAVKTKTALCVNKSFQWKLCDGDYAAISHVWAEGIRADPNGRGLTRRHLSRVFEAISSTGVEWIWLDVIAVPNAGPGGLNLSEEEKILQIEVINTLPMVYNKASEVIILDAMLLQMHTSSPLDVAVGLVCGNWLSRVWTYQEIRLAKTALFVTAEKIFTLKEIRDDLKNRIQSESLVDGQKSKLSSMSLSMDILQFVRDVGISLTDIAFASASRESTYEIDYSRSLFAVLRQWWDPDWTTSAQGMQAIYDWRKKDAGRLVAMYGVKRLKIRPRWAPSRLAGLEGQIAGNMVWEDAGLRGEWYKEQINHVIEDKEYSNGGHFQFTLGHQGEGLRIEVLLGVDEEAQTLETFERAVKSGHAFFICKHKVSETAILESKVASHGLVVEAVEAESVGQALAVEVLFAVAVRAVKGEAKGAMECVLIKH